MLHGKLIQLCLIKETDLNTLFIRLADIRNRGDYFPINVQSEAWLRKQFHESEFWSEDKGLLLIINGAAAIIGHIEFFKPVAYLDSYEFSYLIYDVAERGKGAATEALSLLTEYIFDTKKVNRLQLVIHPDNIASQRVAEKNDFVNEGMMRGAWYHRGQYHDVAIYALLRHEYVINQNTKDR